jgi:pectin methylesterase-like acyl-CoA thioesterase
MTYYRASGRASVPPPAAPKWQRTSGKAYRFVLAAGALAGAIAAIQALWPAADTRDIAHLASTAVAGVPYTEYRERAVAPHPMTNGMRPLSLSLADPSETPAPEISDVSPGEAPTAVATETARSSQTPRATIYNAPAGLDSGTAVAAKNACHEDSKMVGNFCDQQVALLVTQTDDQGKRLTTEQVIQRQDKLFKTMRTVKVARTHKADPVGVVVTADIELEGLRGKDVRLSWAMWQKNGDTLGPDWLTEHLAYRMKATSEDDTASFDFWIPLPKSPGSYFVRSRLSTGTATLATADSEPFR